MNEVVDNERCSNPRKRLKKNDDGLESENYGIYKKNEIILIDEEYKISYDVETVRNIFIKNYIDSKCPFCHKIVSQYLSEGYNESPELIQFEPVNIVEHIRNFHSDNIIIIKNSKVDMTKKIIELTLLKKIVL